MSECNTLTMHQNRFLRVLEDIKRTVKYKIKFEVEEITVMKKKSGHQSLYEFDKVKFIELVNKIQQQQASKHQRASKRTKKHGQKDAVKEVLKSVL